MTRKQSIKSLLLSSLVFLALGGFLLHFRIHPPFREKAFLIPFLSGIFSIIVIPILFSIRSTVAYAYVLNGISVILGTMLMTYFSISTYKDPITLYGLMFKTLLPDIALLWGKFFIGKALFDLELLSSEKDIIPQGRFFRYPKLGWWILHIIAIPFVFWLGHIVRF